MLGILSNVSGTSETGISASIARLAYLFGIGRYFIAFRSPLPISVLSKEKVLAPVAQRVPIGAVWPVVQRGDLIKQTSLEQANIARTG